MSEQPIIKTMSIKPALWLAGIALLVGLFSITVGVQTRFCADQQLKTLTEKVAQLSLRQTQQAIIIQKLNALPTAVAQLQNSQHMQMQRKIAQLNYLIDLANMHLTVGHDVKTALSILTGVQQQLSSNNDMALVDVKQALSTDIAALQRVPMADTHQLFSDIANIIVQIQQLTTVPTPTDLQKGMVQATEKNDANLPWYRQALEKLKNLKNLFVIRHLDEPNTAILALKLEINLKQNMTTQLSMAQWALLHQDQVVYDSTLKTVSEILKNYFALSNAKNAVINQLGVLQKAQINPVLPNLNNTLDALATLSAEVKK